MKGPLVYNNFYKFPFEKLLEKGGSFTTGHYYNIQTLCIELYKVCYNIAQTIFNDLFIRNNNTYNILAKSDFFVPQIKTVLKRSNSTRCSGPAILDLIFVKIKYVDLLETFN